MCRHGHVHFLFFSTLPRRSGWIRNKIAYLLFGQKPTSSWDEENEVKNIFHFPPKMPKISAQFFLFVKPTKSQLLIFSQTMRGKSDPFHFSFAIMRTVQKWRHTGEYWTLIIEKQDRLLFFTTWRGVYKNCPFTRSCYDGIWGIGVIKPRRLFTPSSAPGVRFRSKQLLIRFVSDPPESCCKLKNTADTPKHWTITHRWVKIFARVVTHARSTGWDFLDWYEVLDHHRCWLNSKNKVNKSGGPATEYTLHNNCTVTLHGPMWLWESLRPKQLPCRHI